MGMINDPLQPDEHPALNVALKGYKLRALHGIPSAVTKLTMLVYVKCPLWLLLDVVAAMTPLWARKRLRKCHVT